MTHNEDIENAERRVQAELQVEAFFDLLQTRYGLKSEDIPAILDDMRWLREHRSGINRVTWSIAMGLLGLAVLGLGRAFWGGFVAMIKGN
jgi:hypothetical protein